MEPENSLTYLEQPVTGLYFSHVIPFHTHPISWRSISILSSLLRFKSSKARGVFFSGFSTKTLQEFQVPPMRTTYQPISAFFVLLHC
jgi:hypothetical protein